MMATAIQKNGMKPLNGAFNRVDNVENVENLDNGGLLANTNDDKPYRCQNQQQQQQQQQQSPDADDNESPSEIDIVIRNVVCSFSVRCHLNLREIALRGSNVEYKRENGMITMKLRRPSTTASIWSSGKITCTGAESEEDAKKAARKIARSLSKLGFNVRFSNFRVVNVLGTCLMPWAIRITNFSNANRDHAEYEPELHPGVTYKLTEPRATLKIFSTGSVTITAPNVASVAAAIQQIFPLVYEYRKKRSPEDEAMILSKKRKANALRNADYVDDVDPGLEEPVGTDEDEEDEMAVDSDG